MAEAVVILAPDVRRQQVVQRGDRSPPGNSLGDLQPLRVLVEHRIDDVDERFVAREKSVPAGEQVAFEPALALVLAEHFQHTTGVRDVIVVRDDLAHEHAVRDFEDGIPAIRCRLVGADDAERRGVARDDVADVFALLARGFRDDAARRLDFDGVVLEIGQAQVAQQDAAVRVRVCAHAPIALRRGGQHVGADRAVLVEQFFRAVAAHPGFELVNVLGLVHLAHGDLMRTESAFGLLAVDDFRAGPTLRADEHDHRPGRAPCIAVAARGLLDRGDVVERALERFRHLLVHVCRLMAGDEVRFVAVALQQLRELFLRNSREHGGPGDLVSVQMQDRQHRAVSRRIQEFVGVPARRERAGLRFAVTDHTGDDEIRIVEGCAVRVREGVSQLTALVDRARHFRSDMTRNAAGKRELLGTTASSPLHPSRRRDKARCTCLPDRCSPRTPALHAPGRRRKSCSGHACR